MFKRILLIGFVLLIGGCSTYRDANKDRLNTLPMHYSQFDVKIAWEIRTEDGKQLIEGVLQNVRYATMENTEIWVSAIDAGGKELGRSVSYIIPRTLNKEDSAPFNLTLPVKATSGTKLIFTYKYYGSDGGGSDGGGEQWMQSFESHVP